VQTIYGGYTHDFTLGLGGTPDVEYSGSSYVGSSGQGFFTYRNNTTYFHKTDHLSTPRVSTDYTGTQQRTESNLPFGDGFTETSSPFVDYTGFAGGVWDISNASDTDHFGARDYAKTQGRWLHPDPAGPAAVDPTNPQTWNRYAYALNNPVSFRDPSGLVDPDPGCGGGGGCTNDDAGNAICSVNGIGGGNGGGDPPPPGASPVGGAGGTSCSAAGICAGGPPMLPPGGSPCMYMLKVPSGQTPGTPAKNQNLFTCASQFASKYSIAGGLQALGIGTSGVGGFITNALGGNVFSGGTDLIQSLPTGEGGGHSAFYNMGQSVTAGPSQGLGPVLGNNIQGTPWASGPVDVATTAIANTAQDLITGTGQTIQTLNGTAELGTVLGEVGEWASGFGEAKLGYDAASYGLGLAVCAAK
jgi:RHS repeat-associated protein